MAKVANKPLYIGTYGFRALCWRNAFFLLLYLFSNAPLLPFIITPLFLVGESFKFLREYPLRQKDICTASYKKSTDIPEDLDVLAPTIDYTPPGNIALLFTDIGKLCVQSVYGEGGSGGGGGLRAWWQSQGKNEEEK